MVLCPMQNVASECSNIYQDNVFGVQIFQHRMICIIACALMHAQYASTVCNSNLEYRCTSEGTPRGDSRQRIHVCKRSRPHRHKRHVQFRNAEVNKPEFVPRVNGQYL